MKNSAHAAFRVLTINAGSSSVKFGVFDTSNNTQLFRSEIERVASMEEAVRQAPGTWGPWPPF
jgi:acetate kinase